MIDDLPAECREARARVENSEEPTLVPLMKHERNSDFSANEIDVHNEGHGHAPLARSPAFLLSPFSRREQMQLTGLVMLWACTVILLFSWWFQRDHVVNGLSFAIATLALAWVVCLPAYFFFFLLRSRVPNPALAISSEWRVAMVVTKAPSEPFSVVQATLLGMLSQSLPHDTWIADEDPSPETLEWCNRHGVKVSCRKGHFGYHRSTWPRRTRCKEGNLSFFYDQFGYREYDFVVQKA